MIPQIQFKQYGLNINPSGSRNLDVIGSGWIKELDTSASGVLNFGFIDITTSGSISDTKMLIFRPLTLSGASQIYNFKLFLSNVSAWTTGNYAFLMRTNIPFISGVSLNLTDQSVPTSIPASQNILSTHSGTFIQSTTESGCSQYIYLAVHAANDVLVGQKGGAGAGSFRYKLQYDFI